MTSIRVLLITNDSVYCHRLAAYLGKHHTEIKISIMNDSSEIQKIIAQKTYNVVLIGDEYSDMEVSASSSVACAFLSASSSEMLLNNIKVFCKYKSGEEIYKKILDLYSEVSTGSLETAFSGKRVYAFAGASGGAGTTTVAAAFCFKLASMGKTVLYFSCDKFADSSVIFNDNLQSGSISDLFYAVKSLDGKNVNLSAKTSSLMKKDSQNVSYFDNCRNPLDFDGLDYAQLKKIFDIAVHAGNYDCVITDGSIYDERYIELIKGSADKILIVAENTTSSAAKLKRVSDYLDILDKRDSSGFIDRSAVIMNKNREPNVNRSSFQNMSFVGVIPKYKDSDPRAISNAASRLDVWNNLLKGSD